jgi:hypothetical protein
MSNEYRAHPACGRTGLCGAPLSLRPRPYGPGLRGPFGSAHPSHPVRGITRDGDHGATALRNCSRIKCDAFYSNCLHNKEITCPKGQVISEQFLAHLA